MTHADMYICTSLLSANVLFEIQWLRKSQILYEVAHGDEDGTATTGDEDSGKQISTLISAPVGQC